MLILAQLPNLSLQIANSSKQRKPILNTGSPREDKTCPINLRQRKRNKPPIPRFG
jgi:hypothetical protein